MAISRALQEGLILTEEIEKQGNHEIVAPAVEALGRFRSGAAESAAYGS